MKEKNQFNFFLSSSCPKQHLLQSETPIFFLCATFQKRSKESLAEGKAQQHRKKRTATTSSSISLPVSVCPLYFIISQPRQKNKLGASFKGIRLQFTFCIFIPFTIFRQPPVAPCLAEKKSRRHILHKICLFCCSAQTTGNMINITHQVFFSAVLLLCLVSEGKPKNVYHIFIIFNGFLHIFF